jgi:hypothetical protein
METKSVQTARTTSRELGRGGRRLVAAVALASVALGIGCSGAPRPVPIANATSTPSPEEHFPVHPTRLEIAPGGRARVSLGAPWTGSVWIAFLYCRIPLNIAGGGSKAYVWVIAGHSPGTCSFAVGGSINGRSYLPTEVDVTVRRHAGSV